MRKQRTTTVMSMLAVLCFAEMIIAGIGEKDTTNIYSSVGALAVRDNSDGGVFQVCSGVLVASDVFLTAGHCTAWAEPLKHLFEQYIAPIGLSPLCCDPTM